MQPGLIMQSIHAQAQQGAVDHQLHSMESTSHQGYHGLGYQHACAWWRRTRHSLNVFGGSTALLAEVPDIACMPPLA